MYKDFALVCQAFRQAEDDGYRQGVELATRNPPKIGQEKGNWKRSLHDLSVDIQFSEVACDYLSPAEMFSMLWLIFESAREDGINFVVGRAGYFDKVPEPVAELKEPLMITLAVVTGILTAIATIINA